MTLGVWMLILASKDREHITSLNPRTIAKLTGDDPKAVARAWERLAEPDPESKGHESQGRRIVPLGDGRWRVVQGEKYRLKGMRRRPAEEFRRELVAREEDPRAGKDADFLRGAPPANPLVAGRRDALESEILRLVGEVATAEDKDPEEIMRQASHYTGAARSKLNPASMGDDRLLNTVLDLREWRARFPKGKP